MMRNIVLGMALSIAVVGVAQENKPTFKAEGNLVKATYYYEDGSVKTTGYFKNKKLTGQWARYDKKGNKTQLAFYKDGKKVGKWFMWTDESLKEISYVNNAVEAVNIWKPESRIAVNKDD